MSAWIPVVEVLIWPLLIGAICIWLRAEISRMFRALASRVEQGDAIEAGASGLKLGAAQPKLPESGEHAEALTSAAGFDESIPHSIYLVHESQRDRKLDKRGRAYFRLRIWLDADDSELLKGVGSVTYQLHRTFENPTRKVVARPAGPSRPPRRSPGSVRA